MKNLLKEAQQRLLATQERVALLIADSTDTPLQMKERESELVTLNNENGDFIINY